MSDFFEYLKRHFHEYGFEADKDARFFNILLESFPGANLLDELRAFHIWTLDTNINSTYRSRFYKWLQKSRLPRKHTLS